MRCLNPGTRVRCRACPPLAALSASPPRRATHRFAARALDAVFVLVARRRSSEMLVNGAHAPPRLAAQIPRARPWTLPSSRGRTLGSLIPPPNSFFCHLALSGQVIYPVGGGVACKDGSEAVPSIRTRWVLHVSSAPNFAGNGGAAGLASSNKQGPWQMTEVPKRDEPEDLSIPERILRVQDLWDDIARSSHEVSLTPAQRDEAERRLREYENDPRACSSWEEIRRRLEGAQ